MKKYFSQIFVLAIIFAFVGSFNAYAQDNSAGHIPKVKFDKSQLQKVISNNPPLSMLAGDLAYGYDGTNTLTMPMPAGTPFTYLAAWSAPNFAASAVRGGDGNYYVLDVGPLLYQLDPVTGSPNLIGPITGMGVGATANGITYNPANSTYYLCGGVFGVSNDLYSLDIHTLVATYVLSFPTATGAMIDIAINSSGIGYGYDLVDDNAYTFNPVALTSSVLGPLGFDANYGQGMDIDQATGTVYLSAYNNTTSSGQLRTMNTTTGATTLVVDWGLYEQVAAFAINNAYAPLPGPGLATNPTPAWNATGVDLNQNLFWTNPLGATSIQVFFGTNPASLASIYSGAPVTTVEPGTMAYLTTYYWRVNETNGAGTTIGTLWSFTTMDNPAPLTLPYTQSFDGATFPPKWSQSSTDWSVSASNLAGGSPNEMMATWSSFLGVTRLIVGPITTTGMSSLNLDFKTFWDDYGTGGITAKIQSSADATNWSDEAWSYASGSGNLGPTTISTSITHNLGTQTYIAWVLDGDHYEFDYWYVDDVSIITTPPAPVFSIAPTSKNFGSILVGSSSANQTFTITNTGGSTLTITAGNISITGLDALQFVLSNVPSYPINLTTGQSATVDVKFSPTSVGAKTANLRIVHNAVGSPSLIPLSGVGTNPISTFPYTESFDGLTLPAGWANTQVSGTGLWTFVASGTNPTCTPHSLPGMAQYGCYNFTSGTSAILVSPGFAMPNENYRVVFWMYRDTGYPSYLDRVVVHYSTTPDLTGATVLGTINRSTTQSPVVPTAGWYQYTFNVPPLSSGNAYFIFQGISAFGNNIFVDDVTVELGPNLSPAIAYTPLTNTTGTGNRNLDGVIITDGNGVNNTTTLKPRVYWRVNAGTWTSAATSSGSSPYNFTIGTTALSAGDVVEYFVVAQDLLGAVGANPSAGFTATDVNNILTYPTTPNSYIIIGLPLAGDYTVGTTTFNRITGKNISMEKFTRVVLTEVEVLKTDVASGEKNVSDTFEELSIRPKNTVMMEVEEEYYLPVEDGVIYEGQLSFTKAEYPSYNFENTDGVYLTLTAAIADFNIRGVSGPTRFLLEDAAFNEAAPMFITGSVVNPTTATNTLTIKPNSGVTTTVSVPASSLSPAFVIQTGYVIIDGSNTPGGTTRNMTITNVGTTASSGVAFVTGTDVTIKNIIGMANLPTQGYGIVYSGAVNGIAQNNEIKKASLGIQSQSNASNFTATGNLLGSTVVGEKLQNGGIIVISTTNYSLNGNTISGINRPSGGSTAGIVIGWQGTGFVSPTPGTITKNLITDVKMSGTGFSAYGAFGIQLSSNSATSDIVVANNFISDVYTSGDGSTTGITFTAHGIYVVQGGGYQIYFNSVNMFGELGSTSTSALVTGGLTIASGATVLDLDILNNIFVNSMTIPSGTGNRKSFAIYSGVANTAFTSIDHNDYYATGPQGVLGFLGVDRVDLLAWQTATSQDANSISANPEFISNTDLHITEGSTVVAGLGVSIATVTTDIDGDTRLDPPDIGADEFGATTFQLTVNVANGWNLVSIPGLHPVDQNVDTWWVNKEIGSKVFKFLGGYLEVTTVIPGAGYWMKHTGAQTYNTGEEWPVGGIQIVPHDPIGANNGWNIFGGYEEIVQTNLITTNPPGLWTSGYVFKYANGYQDATTLDPGYGYWIKLDGAGSIIIPDALPKGGGEVTENSKEDWGKILLTDAAGRSYTLYAVKGEVDLDRFELPPSPPAGMFDIRYGSGRIAEDINSAIQTIEMSGVEYPLTVRVEGMDIRLQDVTGKQINLNLKSGEDVVINDATIQKLMVTGELIPTVYALEQNYPNPFNPSTVIEFSLPENVGNVKLSIYNTLGEKVAELVNTALVAGKYSYQWNAQNVATGMYIYELRTDKFVSVKKMLLLK